MWQSLLQHDVLVGATLVAIYQIAKFTELNLADPITRRYIALLPGVTVRDFAGAYRLLRRAGFVYRREPADLFRALPAFAGSSPRARPRS